MGIFDDDYTRGFNFEQGRQAYLKMMKREEEEAARSEMIRSTGVIEGIVTIYDDNPARSEIVEAVIDDVKSNLGLKSDDYNEAIMASMNFIQKSSDIFNMTNNQTKVKYRIN